ncbi:MAG: pilus assembly protein PilP [Thermodesulfovibrionia bacterium]
MIKLFIVLFAFVFVFPISSWTEELPALKPAPVAEVTGDDKEEGFFYEPKGRRDPFIPLIEIKAVKKADRKPRPVGTLESYDISDFKLIAIVEKEGQKYYGLIRASDNKAFTVRLGTVLGLNKGKVKGITSDKLVIEEYIKDYKGELKPRKIVLDLRKGEGK